MSPIGLNWGATAEEQAQPFPCDRYLPDGDAYFRAVTIDAPAAIVFRWLCQMKLAPYSYDWIDNLGRRSPQELLPGTDQLEAGQRVMVLFRLVDFELDRQVTAIARNRLFGDIGATYLIVPESSARCRLVVKLVVKYPRSPLGPVMRALLPPGDLVMMRRQLLNFKRLAERDAAAAQPA